MTRRPLAFTLGSFVLVLVGALVPLVARQPPPSGSIVEWRYHGGDPGQMKYSALADINRDNVQNLAVAWEWKTGEKELTEYGTRPGTFQSTPIMIDNVLYVTTPYNKVVALDAETGKELWSYDPKPYLDGQPPNGTGFVHRGPVAWLDGNRLRIFMNSRYRLIGLDATTGEPLGGFGDGGVVDTSKGLVWEINRKHYTQTSPPTVYKNLLILGNGVGDRLAYHNDPPGDVRAFDTRTGKVVWTFHTTPQPGEFGHETWEKDSWKFVGHTNVWAPMALDAERGLVYLPVTTPSNDYYGGSRPGANLFAESIVCLDAATGQRKWHFQIAHHGLWDYDLASPPVLVTITVAGKTIDAVVQLTKQGWAFVFDRVTGEPVWPIEERPVGKSDVPGEASWPTQPAPVRPPAFSEQGVTLEDAFDLTPALKVEAQAELKKYRLGPMYTPPSLEGTVGRPGNIGGANWGGGAFDPETGLLYVKTTNQGFISKIAKPDRSESNPRRDEVDYELVGRGGMPNLPNGLPLLRPPYGHLTAIDLNRGDISWRVAFGDFAPLRSNPALKGVPLPKRLGSPGAAGVIVTKGGLVIGGGNDTAIYAFDKTTGQEIWNLPMPRPVTATPMTYRTKSGRQFIVVATGVGNDTVLTALALK